MTCDLCSPGSPREALFVLAWRVSNEPWVKLTLCPSHFDHEQKVLAELERREGPYEGYCLPIVKGDA